MDKSGSVANAAQAIIKRGGWCRCYGSGKALTAGSACRDFRDLSDCDYRQGADKTQSISRDESWESVDRF